MSVPQNVRQVFDKLMAEWKRSDKDLNRIEDLIKTLKEVIQEADAFMPIDSSDKSTAVGLILVERKMLEIGVFTKCLKKDLDGFKTAMSHLKHYYELVKEYNDLKESEIKNEIIGLNLMYLLSQNKLTEFHMELERIPPHVCTDDPYVSLPVKLEQYLMEGMYNKIFLSKVNIPSPYYSYFMEILLETVRNEIGNCIEKAYTQLSVKDAARMLFFDGPNAEKDVLAYGERKKWKMYQRKFQFVSEHDKHEEQVINALPLAARFIYYAKQLEMIV